MTETGKRILYSPEAKEELYARVLPDLALDDAIKWMKGEEGCVGTSKNPLTDPLQFEDVEELRHQGRTRPINLAMHVPSEGNKFRMVTMSHPGLHVKGDTIFGKMMHFLKGLDATKTVL